MASPNSELPPNLLLNPRAKAINLDAAPLAKITSTPSSSSTQTDNLTTTGPATGDLRFSTEEEASLLEEATSYKLAGNKFFTASPPEYEAAVAEYKNALSTCPKYLHNERSIYYANISACWLMLEKWKEAEESATQSLVESGDERPLERRKPEKDSGKSGDMNEEHSEEKLSSQEEVAEKQVLQNHKALLRRARAREQLATWSSLQNSLDDYKLLSTSVLSLPTTDQKTVRLALVRLPENIDKKKDEEVGEMMGKLRALGDGILKPFGLSTKNFGMVKDDATGGYSMSFNNGKK